MASNIMNDVVEAAATAAQLTREDDDGWLYVAVQEPNGGASITVFDENGQHLGDL